MQASDDLEAYAAARRDLLHAPDAFIGVWESGAVLASLLALGAILLSR